MSLTPRLGMQRFEGIVSNMCFKPSIQYIVFVRFIDTQLICLKRRQKQQIQLGMMQKSNS